MNAELFESAAGSTPRIGLIDRGRLLQVPIERIIIRNGVKVSALEVENCLLQSRR